MAGASVLLVGSYHGTRGQYQTIQSAVNAGRPGDWILVGSGDYKTSSSSALAGASNRPLGVLITKANLRVRGGHRRLRRALQEQRLFDSEGEHEPPPSN